MEIRSDRGGGEGEGGRHGVKKREVLVRLDLKEEGQVEMEGMMPLFLSSIPRLAQCER